MKIIRCMMAAAMLLLTRSVGAIDYTDLWYQPANAGWGVNVVQSADLLFITFFVYGDDGRPTWYAAQLNRDTSGDFDGYLGALYESTGTPFFLPWQAPAFTVAPVGTASFQPSGAYTATLGYTVRGHARVAALVTRQPLAPIAIDGRYRALVVATSSRCSAPRDGVNTASVSVHASPAATPGTSFDVTYADGVSCTLTGSFAASGKLFHASAAAYACSDGEHGTADFDEVAPTQHGIEGRWSSAATDGCLRTVTFAALPP